MSAQYPIPVAPFTRKVYVLQGVHLPFNCPIIVDSTGMLLTRPDGWPDGYAIVCEPIPTRARNAIAVTSEENQEANAISPRRNGSTEWMFKILERRLKEDLSHADILSCRSSNIDVNYFDSNWILGKHPFIKRLYFACGSNGNSAVHCLALGRAMAELQMYRSFRTLDIGKFSPERLMSEQMVFENIVV